MTLISDSYNRTMLEFGGDSICSKSRIHVLFILQLLYPQGLRRWELLNAPNLEIVYIFSPIFHWTRFNHMATHICK